MENLDRLIPLAILAVLGICVLILLRRSPREKDAKLSAAEPLPAIPVAQPAAVAMEVPAAKIKRKKPIRRRVPAVTAQSVQRQMPVQTVLGLLKDKDTLAAAFLLREILAPPVSQRR
jgi:hypothetical protein